MNNDDVAESSFSNRAYQVEEIEWTHESESVVVGNLFYTHQKNDSLLKDTELPSYNSLALQFTSDEPPKYEIVTGKKLNDELVVNDVFNSGGQTQSPASPQTSRCQKKFALILVLGVTIGVVVTVFTLGIYSQIKRVDEQT